ncbi:hypothetical protein DRJ23_02355, partial [Candidatus Acetothermia bacterium]
MFEQQFLEQRRRLQLTQEKIEERFRVAELGDESKKWARRWLAVESYGQVGLALFDLPPIIERAKDG